MPGSLVKVVKDKFLEKGLNIDFSSAKFGVLNGIVLKDPIIRGKINKNHYIKADSFNVGVSFSVFESNFFSLSSIIIKNGEIQLPLFPEAGKEGANDLIRIANIEAGVFFKSRSVDIKQFSGFFDPFYFSAAGSIYNIEAPALNKSTRKSRVSFNYLEPFIKVIPYKIRKEFYLKYLKIKNDKFFINPKTVPKWRLVFNLDMQKMEAGSIKAYIEMPSFEYRGVDVENLVSTVSVKNTKVTLEKFKINFLDKKSFLNIRGNIDMSNLNISGKSEMKMMPASLKKILRNNRDLIPEFIKIGNEPVVISADLTNFSIHSMKFIGHAKVNIPEVHIKNINISNVEADLNISDTHICSDRFFFSTAYNSVGGSFSYSLKSGIADMKIDTEGPPFLVRSFLPPDAKSHYDTVLKMVQLPNRLSDLKTSLDIHVDPKQDFFFIAGKLNVQDLKYNDVYFDSGKADFYLDSNLMFIVSSLLLRRNDKTCKAALVYDLSDGVKYTLYSPDFYTVTGKQDCLYANLEGNFPGIEYIKCIFPGWSSNVLDLSPSAHIKGDGLVNFKDISKIFFLIKITDSNCFWKEIPVTKFNSDLLFSGETMGLLNANGKVYGGDLAFNYSYNLRTFKGSIDISVANANFAPLANSISGSGLKKQNKGLLSFISGNTFYYDKDDNIFIEGNAKAWIRNGDLWDIPIINEFGELTEAWIGADWGDLTALDGDFIFKKDHLYSDNIRTDGTVISLNAIGSYYWENPNNNNQDSFDYTVKAKILERTFPFKYISRLNPLSWFLETRVYKENGKIQWEKAYVVKKMFGLRKK
jgi:hypothetical protein